MDESIESVVLEFPVRTSVGVQVPEYSTLLQPMSLRIGRLNWRRMMTGFIHGFL